MHRFDVVVTGLDPERPRSEVIAAIARRLAKSATEIEERLESAPAAIVRAVSEEDAQRLVADLRALGARVKPRTEGPELEPTDDASAPADKPAIQLLYWSAEEDGYERPRVDPPPEQEPAPKSSAPPPPPPVDEPDAPVVPPIIVRSASEWFTPSTASAPAPTAPAAPPLEATPIIASLARFGRAAADAPIKPEPPRVFFGALRHAFVLPLHRTLLPALALSSLLAVLAMGTGVVGLRSDLELGPLLLALSITAAVGFVGLLHQAAGACLTAITAGERVPSPLPGRLMDDYLRPGAFSLATIAAIGTLAVLATDELITLRATLLTLGLFWSFLVLYGVFGFSLAAASQSALGYLDLSRIVRVIVRAPLYASVVGWLGATLLGSAIAGEIWLFTAAVAARSWITIVIDIVILGPFVSFAVSYAAALTASVMGLCLYASAVR